MMASTPSGALADWLASWRHQAGGAALGLAVSGGGDSVALLRLMADHVASLAGPPLQLFVYTVDHGLRPEAAAEALWVADLCQRLGLRHRSLTWRWDGRGNLAEAARHGRYAALVQACRTDGVSDCLLAHSRDDNIECLFLGLLRGAGLDGLAGMRSSFQRLGLRFHRPFLLVSRADLRAELQDRGQGWHEDPTNSDLTHERARIRHLLRGLDLPEARLAQSLAALAATRRDLGQEVLARLDGAVRTSGPDLAIDLAPLTRMTPEFRRRVISAALKTVSSSPHPPRAAQILRLVHRDWRAQPQVVTLGGCRIWRLGDDLRFGREYSALPPPVPADETWEGWQVFGPDLSGIRLGALGPLGHAQVTGEWRQQRIPYASLLASPAVWQGGRLLAAAYATPILAENAAEWHFTGRDLPTSFRAAVLAH